MTSPPITRAVLIAASVALMTATVSACGAAKNTPRPSGSPSGSPAVSFAKASSDAYTHSVCMRSHGVTNFPDPQTADSAGKVRISIRLSPSIVQSPAFQSAQKSCAHLMPGAGNDLSNGPSAAQRQARTDGILAFAACMRRHGFPRFPDPNSIGQLTLSQIQGAGINLEAPAVKPAALSCVGVSHGQLTKDDVERAIASGGASGSQSASVQQSP